MTAAGQRTGSAQTTLTPRGWTLLGGALGLVIGSRLLAADALAVPGIAAGLVLGAGWLFAARASVAVAVERTVGPARPQAGDAVAVRLRIAPGGRRGAAPLELAEAVPLGREVLRFAVPALDPRATVACRYEVRTTRRGRLTLGPAYVVLHDPFGLVVRTRLVAAPTELVVRPRVHALRAGRGGSGRVRDALTVGGPGPTPEGMGDFFALRPYQVGDDLRRVHWRTSARTGDLVVRQDAAAWHAPVTVVLDDRTGVHDADSFEVAVSACASIAVALHRHRRPFSVLTASGSRIGPDVGAAIDGILDALAVVEPADAAAVAVAATRRRRHDHGAGALVVIAGRPDPELLADAATRCPARSTVLLVTRPVTTTLPRGLRVVDLTQAPLDEAWNQLLRWRPPIAG